jgi:hypothetical protein
MQETVAPAISMTIAMMISAILKASVIDDPLQSKDR